MKRQWVKHCLDSAKQPADLFSGCRKILRTRQLAFYSIDDKLQLVDSGYRINKMRALIKGYVHEESRTVALGLWERRRQQDSYGSVGFTTYNHYLKNDPIRKAKRASVMGPCIQSLTITYINRDAYAIDCFYRTTELFKKFPADLVFIRDVLLREFDFQNMKLQEMTCHFANITIHPMYFATLIPSIPSGRIIDELEQIREADEYFWGWIVKWTARYLVPEYHRGIQKFAQAMKVHEDAKQRIDPATMKSLVQYLSDNHPGYKRGYIPPEEKEL